MGIYQVKNIYFLKLIHSFFVICTKVPVFGFGENEIYDVRMHELSQKTEILGKLCVDLANLKTKQFWIQFVGAILSNLHFAFLIFTTLPKRIPLTTVVGKPIQVTRIENPTQEQIDQLHKVYVNELTALFEEHKDKYLNNKKIDLEII